MNATNTPVATATSSFVAGVQAAEVSVGLVKAAKRTRVRTFNAPVLVRALQILEDNVDVQRAARKAQEKADAAKKLIVEAMGDHALVLIGDKKVALTRTQVASYTVPAYEKVAVKAV